MSNDDSARVTHLLAEVASGRSEAMDDLLPLVYTELRNIARRQRFRHRPYETLHTTALVNEAFLRLAGKSGAAWEDRTHFLSAAALAMRSVLVDYARRQRAAKRGGGAVHHPIEEFRDLPEINHDEVLAVHTALERLEAQDPRQAQVVELRYFVGLSVRETAEALEISPASVKREWAMARAWLKRDLEAGS